MLTEFPRGPSVGDTAMAKTQSLFPRTSPFIGRLAQMISTPPLRKQHTAEGHSPVLGGVGWGARSWEQIVAGCRKRPFQE